MVADHEEEQEAALTPHNVVDLVVFGRRLRALRVLNGYDRVGDLTTILRGKYGVEVSDRTVYAIERGEQMPHIDFLLAVCAALNADHHYFAPAVRPDVIDGLNMAATEAKR